MLGFARNSNYLANPAGFTAISAVGGTTSTFSLGGITYREHRFTATGVFTVTNIGSSNLIDVLIVAGGGGGGFPSGGRGCGGGAGGQVRTVNTGVSVSSYTITVGAAGSAGTSSNLRGGTGTNSTAIGVSSLGGKGGGGGSAGSTDPAPAASGAGTGGSIGTLGTVPNSAGAGGGAGSVVPALQGGAGQQGRGHSRGASQGVHERGFASAIAAQQSQGFALVEAERDFLQHHGLAIAGFEVFDLQQFSHGGPPRRGPGTPP